MMLSTTKHNGLGGLKVGCVFRLGLHPQWLGYIPSSFLPSVRGRAAGKPAATKSETRGGIVDRNLICGSAAWAVFRFSPMVREG